MAVDYKRYLAENVLNERRTVNYRSLSRALKVHSNLAKQMLYEFHHNENNKKPNSVNATYVITGIQKVPETSAANGSHSKDEDEDQIMQSSPYLGSSMPKQDQDIVPDTIKTTSILLAREEDFEDAKSTFESISTIHVYSLQPTILQDLNVLTDVCREMVTAYAHEDPLEHGKEWGMIQNKNVKRRTGARPPPPAAPAASSANTTSSKPSIPAKRPLQKEAPPQPKPDSTKEQDAASNSKQQSQTSGTEPAKPTERTAPPKAKGSIFSSFAKAKPKQKKETPAAPEPSSTEEAQLKQALDDASEDEPEELFPDSGKSEPEGTRESRKEREEKLRKMMEDEDEEEEEDDKKDEDEEMADAADTPEESTPLDQPLPKKPEPKEEVTVQGGRRRGKRQVMKKKTIKDEEGYLVTVEEPSWESFSEDEPAPPKKKPAVSAPKGKSGPKPGQGNIMSFFGKK